MTEQDYLAGKRRAELRRQAMLAIGEQEAATAAEYRAWVQARLAAQEDMDERPAPVVRIVLGAVLLVAAVAMLVAFALVKLAEEALP